MKLIVDLKLSKYIISYSQSIVFIICTILSVEDVTSGEVKINLNYGNIPIIDETLDLCNLISQISLSCPLNKNKDVKFTLKRELPDYVPSVSITVTLMCRLYYQ